MRFWQKYSWIIAISAAILLLVVVVVFGAGLRESDAKTATTVRTGVVRRADFENINTVQGNLFAVNDLNLTFQVTGVILSVQAKPGQAVQRNEPLAQLDTRDYQLALNVAEANLKQAQAKLDFVKANTAKDLATAQGNLRQAQQKLDQVKNGNATRGEVAVAKAALDEAQAKYNRLVSVSNANDVTAADADLKKAKANLDKLKAGAGAQAIKKAESDLEAAKQTFEKTKSNAANAKEIAKLNLEQAKKNYDAAELAYKKLYAQNRNPDGSLKPDVTDAAKDAETKAKADLDKADSEVKKATSNNENAVNQEAINLKEGEALVAAAQAALDKIKQAPASQEIDAAQADVNKAQAFLDKAKAGPSKGELDAAQAELNKAKAALDKLSSPGTEKDLVIAQTEVDKWQAIITDLTGGTKSAELNEAQAGLEAADIQVKQARFKLDQTTLRAPFDGIIGMVNLVPGQSVGGNNVGGTVALTSLAALQARFSLEESVIAMVQTGQPALLRLENLPNSRIMTGVVTFISPKAILSSRTNKYNYDVLIEIDTTTEFSPLKAGYKPGMSVEARIIVERQQEVLLVPNESLKRLGADTVVEVLLPDGQITTVPVVPGSSNAKETILLEPTLLKPSDRLVLSAVPLATTVQKSLTISPDPNTSPLPATPSR